MHRMKNSGELFWYSAEGVNATNSQAKELNLDGTLESQGQGSMDDTEEAILSGRIFQVKKQRRVDISMRLFLFIFYGKRRMKK